MKTRVALNGNDGTWRIGVGEKVRWERFTTFDWEELEAFLSEQQGQHIFIALSYELRSNMPHSSAQTNHSAFPLISLWVPENVYTVTRGQVECISGAVSESNESIVYQIVKNEQSFSSAVTWRTRQTKEDYIQQVRKLQSHIQQGDCYEVNYCQEFFAENVRLDDPIGLYHRLNDTTRAPFSLFFENRDWVIASASPERFLKKEGSRLISQPIKGTAPRGGNEAEDNLLKAQLSENMKDRTENVMIVDLVRNDLSRVAAKGSVKVGELFGVYTFPTVHQLISTVSCDLKEGVRFSDILLATFPMGSMTGAPKVAAMEMAQETERFIRGIYSGSIGYITPNGDFDLNVMIRSLVFDKKKNYLSCGVGGAITALSDPEEEYEECRTKVGRILETFGTCQW